MISISRRKFYNKQNYFGIVLESCPSGPGVTLTGPVGRICGAGLGRCLGGGGAFGGIIGCPFGPTIGCPFGICEEFGGPFGGIGL